MSRKGGRTRPLNVGFQHARGEYIAILDDDDIPMGHWVAEFSNLARNYRGRVLRTACVSRTRSMSRSRESAGYERPESWRSRIPPTFGFLEHMCVNFSPPICLAFPREAFHRFGLRFDERLSTSEDWDFLLQAAALCGIADSPEITGVYRQHDENSRAILPEEQWAEDFKLIRSKLENTWIILPKGESSRIIGHLEASHRLEAANSERDDAAKRLRAVESERDDVANQLRVAEGERNDAANRSASHASSWKGHETARETEDRHAEAAAGAILLVA